jgi:hypothetical protein
MSYPDTIYAPTTIVDAVDEIIAANINTPNTELVDIETELGTDPAGSATDVKTRLAVALADDGNLRLTAGSTITISSGVAAQPSNNFHLLLPESGTADDLDTITATTIPDGFVLVLAQAASTNAITFKHNTGNILCSGGADIVMSLNSEIMTLIYSTGLTKWRAYLSGHGRTYGGFYVDDGSIATTLTTDNVYYPVMSGMSTGDVKNVTFQNSRELKIISAGLYRVDVSITASCNNANEVIEVVVLGGAAGTTANVKTLAAAEFITVNKNYHISGFGFMTCAVDDLIRIGLENETSAGKIVTIRHANLIIQKM